MLDDVPAVGLERVVEQRPIGSRVRAQVVWIDAIQLRGPTVELRELGGTGGVVWNDEPIGIFVVADRYRGRRIELPDAVEKLIAELALKGSVCGCLGGGIRARRDQCDNGKHAEQR